MATRLLKRIPEGATISCTLSATTVSTAGKTVYAYAISRAGSAVTLGTASGAAAASSIVLALNFDVSGITAGDRYTFQVIADPTGTPVMLVPNTTYSEIEFLIVDGVAIT